MKFVRNTILILGLIGAACSSHAVPITYELSFDDNGGNTVRGTITTDGTIGSLSLSNFLSWSWKAEGAPTFDISGACPGSCSITTGWSATTDGLFYDFGHWEGLAGVTQSVFSVSDPQRAVTFQALNSGSGRVYWNNGFARLGGENTEVNFTGNQLVGTPVPEPMTLAIPATPNAILALTALGVVGIGYSRRKAS